MADFSDIIRTMKKASVGAVHATNPVDVLFGEVVGTNPLEIFVEQKLTLGERQLILTRNVTDYDIEITDIERKSITIHNSLTEGEKIVLLRMKGGQKFIVLDRLEVINDDTVE